MSVQDRPVLFVTNYAPPARVGAFAALAEREDVVFALFGGRVHHGAAEQDQPLPFPHVRVTQREAGALARSGGYRAVVCGTTGRTALPAAYRGARRAGVPFVLWATLWAQPKGPAGMVGYPVLRYLYARADAVATYGRHVSDYVTRRGARNVHTAPQAVDNAFWRGPAQPRREAPFQALFAGRLRREKGVRVLLDAWSRTGFESPDAALVLAGRGPERSRAQRLGAVLPGELDAVGVRNFQAGSDVVVMPSIRTLTFREPWGLVANEAMNRGRAIIATDAVGAVAGGLVRHGRNALVVHAGDPGALAGALRRLRDDPAERERLGAAGREDVADHDHAAWADGISRALAAAGASRGDAGARRARAPQGA